MTSYTVLVKLANAGNHKLTFPKKPSVKDVKTETHKQAGLAPELDVVLSADDPDFPGTAVVLSSDAEIRDKMVLTAETKIKEAQSWDEVDCPPRSKTLLSENGISPSVALILVSVLGFTDPEDLQHVTPQLLEKLPLKPLEKVRFEKLVAAAKSGKAGASGGGAAAAESKPRPPSARFAQKAAELAAKHNIGAGAAAAAAPAYRTQPATPPSPTAASKSKPSTSGSSSSPAAAAAAHKPKPSTTGKKGDTGCNSLLSGMLADSNTHLKPGKKSPATSGGDAPSPLAAAAARSQQHAEVLAGHVPAPAAPAKTEEDEEDELLAMVLAEGASQKAQVSVSANAGIDQSKFKPVLQKGEMVACLQGHTESVLSLALTPDGCTLFSASGDNLIKVWNIKGLILAQSLAEHATSVGALAMNKDGDELFSASGDGTVIAWHVVGGRASKAFAKPEAHDYGILAMKVSNSGTVLFTGSADKTIRGWTIDMDGHDLVLAFTLSGHLASVRSLALSPDDTVLYSASEDATIKVWTMDQAMGYKFMSAMRGHEAAVYSLAMSRDGSTLLSASGDKTISVWRVKPNSKDLPTLKQVLTGHKGEVNCVVLSAEGTHMMSSGDDKTVRVWGLLASANEPTFALQYTLEGHALIVYPLAVSTDGAIVFSGSADNTVRVWRLGYAS
mmetsp:Transcript_35284/g.89294  ORF Transcript_35284/g.89294 Transcript_35284/m.89294 type:complete len:671 (-) Transcript_35284:239-2251(-)